MRTTLHKAFNDKTSYKLVCCGALVLEADSLFYCQKLGWTLGIFGALLLMAIALCNQVRTPHALAAFCASGGLVFALVNDPNGLNAALYTLTTVAATLLTKLNRLKDARYIFLCTLQHIATGWWQLQRDSVIMARIKKRLQKRHSNPSELIKHWLLPCGLSLVFMMLFASANPIITRWVNQVNWAWIASYFSLQRCFFWLAAASLCWAVIRPRFKKPTPPAQFGRAPVTSQSNGLFNARSIFSSLVLFNGLFLMENLLDIAFLWTGMALPQGMSYAEYAHHGAYPLMATALMAALFVLIALRPGSDTEAMPAIRTLVYAWVGQNVFLVFSSILRLAGYVGQYSLTYLRVEAFIWMGLVAAGLTLIVARIYLRKSNLWLINSNSIALYATIYSCCFINFGGLIANYNVAHCAVAPNAECHLDMPYLEQMIGIDALPALARLEVTPNLDAITLSHVKMLRMTMESSLYGMQQDWHQWTLHHYRLANPSLPLDVN